MKKRMLLAIGITMLFCQVKLQAQEEGVKFVNEAPGGEVINDTLLLTLTNSDKVLIIDRRFNEMYTYTRADSLKTLFIADMEKAISQGQLTTETENIHYFVQQGNRRLKSENPEFTRNTIDVAYEMVRLQLGLPKHRIIIYDMQSGVLLHFYLKTLADYKTVLGSVSLDAAIKSALAEKSDRKRFYKIEVKENNNVFAITNKSKSSFDMIELAPSFGVGIMGNTIAPLLGADIYLTFTNKYNFKKYRVGGGLTTFPFVQGTGDVITKVSFVKSYELRAMYNLNGTSRKDNHWFGLQGGILSAEKSSTYNKAYKVGLVYDSSGPFSYSFDLIRDNAKQRIFGFTMKMLF